MMPLAGFTEIDHVAHCKWFLAIEIRLSSTRTVQLPGRPRQRPPIARLPSTFRDLAHSRLASYAWIVALARAATSARVMPGLYRLLPRRNARIPIFAYSAQSFPELP